MKVTEIGMKQINIEIKKTDHKSCRSNNDLIRACLSDSLSLFMV